MALKLTKLAARVLTIAVVGAMLSAATPLPGQLTFNELKVGEGALNFYNGGLGSQGTGPGPNFGISFTPDFVTVAGGIISPNLSVLQSEQLASPSGTMNILGGFRGQFSFYYLASQSSSAELFSGLNGTGNVIGLLSLPVTSLPWFPAGGNFAPFESVIFTGNGLTVDNITFGGLVIPEPFPVVLLPAGLILLFAVTALKRRTQDS